MKNRHIHAAVIAAVFLSVLFPAFSDRSQAYGQDVGEVPDITSPSGHSDIPSQNPVIEVSWDIPDGDPYGYLVLFNTSPEHTFDDLNSEEAGYVTERSFEKSFAASQPDDVAYYFHIAAADGDGMIGPTVTAGPYRVDMVPPSDVSVSAPEITSSRTVTLSLRATGATEMRISDTGYGEGGEREPFAETRERELPAGGGEKTVYVRYCDPAGNTADASAVITFVAADADGDLVTGLEDAVLILRLLAGTYTGDINPDADVNSDGKIGAEEVICILKETAERE